jgi:HK97 gp10 family phage protein
VPSVAITGVREIDRALKGLEPKLAKKVLRQALRSGLKPVLAQVRANAPVGETGALKGSIKIYTARTRKKVIKLRVVAHQGKGRSPHAAAVEFGTANQDGRHFERDAFDATKDRARQIAVAEIRAGVERVAKG